MKSSPTIPESDIQAAGERARARLESEPPKFRAATLVEAVRETQLARWTLWPTGFLIAGCLMVEYYAVAVGFVFGAACFWFGVVTGYFDGFSEGWLKGFRSNDQCASKYATYLMEELEKDGVMMFVRTKKTGEWKSVRTN